jgi:hypothetical protein
MPLRFDGLLGSFALTAAIVVSGARIDEREGPATSSAMPCTKEIFPGFRDSLTTTLLGRAGRDTIAAGAGVVDRRIAGGFGQFIHGQVVLVDSMLGPGAHLARRAPGARQSTEVLIVPWGNNPDCGIDLWRHSALWIRPDSSGLFSVRLRPESLWVSGRPTFDAFFAVNYSYADGPHIIGPHTVIRGLTEANIHGKGSMTPAEVFSLYSALPAVGQATDSIAIERLLAWVRANPSVRTRYPGNLILQQWPLDPVR